MTSINWNSIIQTPVSFFYEKVLPLFADQRIRIVAAVVLAALSLVFAFSIFRCLRGRISSKANDEADPTVQPQTNLVMNKNVQTHVKDQSLETENRRLKDELEAARKENIELSKKEKVETTGSDQKDQIESLKKEIQKLKGELETEQANKQKFLKEAVYSESAERIETLARVKELEVQIAESQAQLKTKETELADKKKTISDYAKEIDKTRRQIQDLQSKNEKLQQLTKGLQEEDIELLKQLKHLLNLDSKTKFDKQLKQTCTAQEAKKLLNMLSQLRKLQSLITAEKEYSKFKAKEGASEAETLSSLIKLLLSDWKALKRDIESQKKRIEVLESAQNDKTKRRAEQSVNTSQMGSSQSQGE